MRAPAPPIEQTKIRIPALTVEVALYAACAITALILRLFVLDTAPLSNREAMQALASWQWINGRSSDFAGSPLLFAGNALLFLLGGASDFAARFWPAVFGSALVLLPALVRRELGRTGAVVASLLLVFSPSLVYFSRSTDGAIIAVTCAFAALAWGWRYVTDRAPLKLYLASVAGALALLASREVWTVVLSGGLFALLAFSMTRRLAAAEDIADGPIHAAAVERDRRVWLNAGILFGAVLVGISTLFLTHREGLGATFGLFGSWIAGLQLGGPLYDPLRLLVVYEPIVLFFGVVALVDLAFALRAWDREQTPLAALAIIALVAFVLYSIGGDKNPARTVVILVPLTLLAGWNIGLWYDETMDQLAVSPDAKRMILSQELPIFFFACAMAAFLYIVVSEFATRGSVVAADVLAALLRMPAGGGSNGVIFAALIIVAVAVVTFLAVTTVGWARARNLGLTLALIFLTLWTIRQMTTVNFQARDSREWLVARATSPNVLDLVRDLKDISRWRANDTRTLSLLVDSSLGPLVEWYLRDFVNARFVTHPTMGPDTQALLASPHTAVNASKLMSQHYVLETTSAPDTPANLLRWLIFRDTGGEESTGAVLWIAQPQ